MTDKQDAKDAFVRILDSCVLEGDYKVSDASIVKKYFDTSQSQKQVVELRDALIISTSVFEHVQKCADWLRENHKEIPPGHSIENWLDNLMAPVKPRIENNPLILNPDTKGKK